MILKSKMRFRTNCEVLGTMRQLTTAERTFLILKRFEDKSIQEVLRLLTEQFPAWSKRASRIFNFAILLTKTVITR